MKYSTLTQITPANVSKLTKAWTYDTGAGAVGYTVTPIVIGNVMYLPIQGSIIVALKADAGTELWRFDLRTLPGIAPNPSAGGRGISYWPGTHRRRRASSSQPRTVFSFSSTRKPARRFRARRFRQHGDRRDGKVWRHLLDQHAARALPEPGYHRRTHG